MKIEKIKSLIKKNYNICEIIRIEKLDINASYTFYKIITLKKNYFFKIQIKRIISVIKDYHKKMEEILTELSKLNLKLNLPIRTKKNKNFVSVTKKGYFYDFYLYDFLEIDKNNSLSKKQREEAIKQFANFHKKTKKLKLKLIKPHNILNFASMTAFVLPSIYYPIPILKLAKAKNTKFSKKILKYEHFLKDLMLECFHYLSKVEVDKPQLIHYDFNQGNIFFSKGKFLTISDFEYSEIKPIQEDIIKAARFWALEDGNFSIKKFNWFIKTYLKYNKVKITPITIYVYFIFLVIRRINFSCQMTLDKKFDLEFLFDSDIKDLKEFLKFNKIKNKFEP